MRTESTIAWCNENEGRAYPIDECATRVANNGSTLPDDIIVDIGIMVPPAHTDIFVSSIRVTDTIVSISLRSVLSGLMIGTFPRSTVRAYAAYPLTPVVDNVTGWVAFGAHKTPNMVEDYRFSSFAQSGLERRVIKTIDTLPVRRFLRLSGRSAIYADSAVTLVAGNNVVITGDIPNNKIIIKLAPGSEGRFASPCKDRAIESICGVPPIRKINGVCADANGVITLRFE